MQESKTALILNGSPRIKQGHTTLLSQQFIDALQQKNWETKAYNLYSMQFKGCSHCDACKKINEHHSCILKDDFEPVLDLIEQVELIVIASPVYCWSVSGCMSAALDRWYSLFKTDLSLLKGKKIVGIFTAGGDEFDGMDLCVEMLKRLSDYGGAVYAGTIAVANCYSDADILNEQQHKKIMNFVDQL